jgi:hypothetical protein
MSELSRSREIAPLPASMVEWAGQWRSMNADPAKAFVLRHIGQIVASGHAEWRPLENGDVELRLQTGEVFLLAETTIGRVL